MKYGNRVPGLGGGSPRHSDCQKLQTAHELRTENAGDLGRQEGRWTPTLSLLRKAWGGEGRRMVGHVSPETQERAPSGTVKRAQETAVALVTRR